MHKKSGPRLTRHVQQEPGYHQISGICCTLGSVEWSKKSQFIWRDRQLCYVEGFGKTKWQHVMTSDDLSNFPTHLMTFHNLVMTTTLGDDILKILMTLGHDILMTMMTLVKVLWWPSLRLMTTICRLSITTLMFLVTTEMTFDDA